MSTFGVLWSVITVLCFVLGLLWSRRRLRRRLQERMGEAVDNEIKRQISEEVLRQLREGPKSEPPHHR